MEKFRIVDIKASNQVKTFKTFHEATSYYNKMPIQKYFTLEVFDEDKNEWFDYEAAIEDVSDEELIDEN